MKPLTYEKLITCNPLYHVDFLAGRECKKNQCQHVFLNELPEAENSLVLLDLASDTIPLLEKSIKDNNCSGIVILSKQSFDLPSPITNLADQTKKPIFTLKNYNGEELLKRINQIFDLHKLGLLDLIKNELTTYWIELLNQDGIERVMDRFTMFLGQEAFLFTEKKELVPLLTNKYTAHDFKKLEWVDSTFTVEDLQISVIHSEKAEFYSFEISNPDGQTLGYLLFEKIRSPEELPLHLLKTIAPVINSWSKQKEVSRKVHLLYKDQFLFDILHNNFDTESEIIELGKLRDMEFTQNTVVLSISLNSHHAITKEMVMSIQQLLIEKSLKEANFFTTFLNHRIIGIVCPKIGVTEIAKNDLHHWISDIQNLVHRKYPQLQTKIGVGRRYFSNIDIYKSFQESKIALQMEVPGPGTDSIIHYEDLGYVRLLSYIHNDLLRDFSYQYLEKLKKYDLENETELVHTLTIYCYKNGDISRTAEDLFIHQNTLRQRLRKIETILDMDLSNYTNLVNIILSLQISQDTNIE